MNRLVPHTDLARIGWTLVVLACFAGTVAAADGPTGQAGGGGADKAGLGPADRQAHSPIGRQGLLRPPTRRGRPGPLGLRGVRRPQRGHHRRGPGDRVAGKILVAADARGMDAAGRFRGSQEVPAGLRISRRGRAGEGDAGAGRIAPRRRRRRLVPFGAVREVAAAVEDGGLGPAFPPFRRRAAPSRGDQDRSQDPAGLQAVGRRLVVGLDAVGRRARGRDVAVDQAGRRRAGTCCGGRPARPVPRSSPA